MSDELKPCPFCGSTPKYLYNPAYDVHCIWCPNKLCGVRPDVDSHVSKDQAVENWNKRAEADTDALRAQWESVPWEELYAATVLGLVWAAQATDDAAGGMDACNRALEWLAANAPKETTDD